MEKLLLTFIAAVITKVLLLLWSRVTNTSLVATPHNHGIQVKLLSCLLIIILILKNAPIVGYFLYFVSVMSDFI